MGAARGGGEQGAPPPPEIGKIVEKICYFKGSIISNFCKNSKKFNFSIAFSTTITSFRFICPKVKLAETVPCKHSRLPSMKIKIHAGVLFLTVFFIIIDT